MLPKVVQPLPVMLATNRWPIQQLHALSSCTGQEASSCLYTDIKKQQSCSRLDPSLCCIGHCPLWPACIDATQPGHAQGTCSSQQDWWQPAGSPEGVQCTAVQQELPHLLVQACGSHSQPQSSLIDNSTAGPCWAASLTVQSEGAEECEVAAVLQGCWYAISAVLQGCHPHGPEGKVQRIACELRTCWAASAGGASCCTCQSVTSGERQSPSGQHTMAASPAPGRSLLLLPAQVAAALCICAAMWTPADCSWRSRAEHLRAVT